MKKISIFILIFMFSINIMLALPVSKTNVEDIVSNFKNLGASPQAVLFLQDELNKYLIKAKQLHTPKIDTITKEIKKQATLEKFNLRAYNKAITELNKLNTAINREYYKVITKSFSKMTKKDKEILSNMLNKLYPLGTTY